MSQKCEKKLVLLKTYYYRNRTQDGQSLANATNYVTNPLTASDSSIRRMTDKNFNPIDNGFVEFTTILIPDNNPISGITNATFQDTVMIKTKCGFVSANTFYFDSNPSTTTFIPIVDYPVTASSGNLKNAVQVIVTVLAVGKMDPKILAVNAASLALNVSPIPFAVKTIVLPPHIEVSEDVGELGVVQILFEFVTVIILFLPLLIII